MNVNIAYCNGTAVSGASDPRFTKRAVNAYGPLLYNAAGDARLSSNVTVGVAAKIAIHADALAANAMIRLAAVAGGLYVTTGMEAEANIAVGGGWYIAQGTTESMPIGQTLAGAQHTHLLVIEAA